MIWIVRRDNDTMKADYVAMYFIDKYTIGHYFKSFCFVPFYFATTKTFIWKSLEEFQCCIFGEVVLFEKFENNTPLK